ncbi:UDP-4-amino-4,6-dideoxy-N-acetyl-beta-L-altrosamine transaminase [Paenibacillus tianjinensis]|uniref:UDP-4-amino-4, 6-dideoxy-N-acetyl-beta-L-altrosamine transaminase n=1 Tax=Paenibacillus tianjinensis TaxID=2810347 RepID=A0ABX7LAL5_9BACL|nr:UDP-4-amino-4,6-dideoxy-N-acetyl-beta-L-altrosamine transaminase [Paenibacillus tianjinensis]QSF43798.1 UDP-4-amino-4,6-dideoxy-N-acetyl-beta-L-altrosamine transaminase [Paenibacillus tianjinensis]
MSGSTLAIHGGTPVRSHYLPYGRQFIDEADIASVVQVLQSDFITTGPAIEQFEAEIARITGAKYAVAFTSGTAALHGACFAAGIGEGDEVITTPMTFAASANCVLYQGATPVFADIDPQTYNLDPKRIREKLTKHTKAIIPVHFTGQPAELDEIHTIARENNLVVIEDAAHALGAQYKNKSIGSIGDMTMFSFHPVKHITTGEGGMITTNNPLYYEKLLQFRSHGITRNPDHMIQNHGPWYYEMQFLGYNYRLTDIQAALGISQLKKLEQFVDLRKKYAAMYNEAFRHTKTIQIPYQSNSGVSSWHLYIIALNLEQLKGSRKNIFEALLKENIGVNVHYIPVHLLPYYQELGYKQGLCPNAEQLYNRIITLPLFQGMSEQDVHDVIRAVNKVLNHYSK